MVSFLQNRSFFELATMLAEMKIEDGLPVNFLDPWDLQQDV